MREDIQYTSADGLSLYAKAYGPQDAALTVLCMHGLTRNHKDFEPMIAAIGGHRRYIAVDVRGRGQSARASDPATYTPAIYIQDMAALLDQLGVSEVALIGTSMGGLMSMLMVKAMPERIRGVVLNDVGPHLDKAGLDRIAGYASDVVPAANWAEAADVVERVNKDVFPEFQREDWIAFAQRTYRKMETGQVILDYDPEITRSVGEVRPGLMTRIAMWRLYAAMKKTPLLIIRGANSDILSAKTAKLMAKRHPGARLIDVPDRGHAPLLDEPSAVQAISEFLNGLDAA